jgi:hypothetical protein
LRAWLRALGTSRELGNESKLVERASGEAATRCVLVAASASVTERRTWVLSDAESMRCARRRIPVAMPALGGGTGSVLIDDVGLLRGPDRDGGLLRGPDRDGGSPVRADLVFDGGATAGPSPVASALIAAVGGVNDDDEAFGPADTSGLFGRSPLGDRWILARVASTRARRWAVALVAGAVGGSPVIGAERVECAERPRPRGGLGLFGRSVRSPCDLAVVVAFVGSETWGASRAAMASRSSVRRSRGCERAAGARRTVSGLAVLADWATTDASVASIRSGRIDLARDPGAVCLPALVVPRSVSIGVDADVVSGLTASVESSTLRRALDAGRSAGGGLATARSALAAAAAAFFMASRMMSRRWSPVLMKSSGGASGTGLLRPSAC